jgi:hypothetical protein
MPKIRASSRKLVYNLIKRQRLSRIRIQALTHIINYKVKASYLVKRRVKKAIKRGLFRFLHIFKSKN